MAVHSSDVVAQMRAALGLSEPDLDTTVGTTTRKILDAVGEVVAEAYVDRYLLDYQYDIDGKTHADLDDFVALFGFSRLAAKRAAGTVTFERSNTIEHETFIPRGTQMATDGVNAVVVTTIVPAIMARADLSVTVPVQAVKGGTAGNIGANALSRILTPVSGVGSFTNMVALTGGSEPESDPALRSRFKRTIFRNLAGTEQMFRGTALEDADVKQVNILGAARVNREQVDVVGGTATSGTLSARHSYEGTTVFGPSIDQGLIFTEGIHYSFDYVTRTVTMLHGLVPDGVYELEFEYVPEASRNDPPNGVTNRVDLYVKGERPIDVEEVAIFRTSRKFVSGSSAEMAASNFARIGSGSAPEVGSHFIALTFAPVLQAPSLASMTIDGSVYVQDTDFWTVNNVTRDGGTLRSLSGIEFRAGVTIPNNHTFNVPYIYNAVPGDVEGAVRDWRLLTTDVRVHTAHLVRLRVNMIVILEPGFTQHSVEDEVGRALSVFLDTIDFASVVQVSDVLSELSKVPGVDAVRIKTSADDPVNFAIQQMSGDGSVLQTYAKGNPGRATDVLMDHNEIPQFHSVTVEVRAQNTFGEV